MVFAVAYKEFREVCTPVKDWLMKGGFSGLSLIRGLGVASDLAMDISIAPCREDQSLVAEARFLSSKTGKVLEIYRTLDGLDVGVQPNRFKGRSREWRPRK